MAHPISPTQFRVGKSQPWRNNVLLSSPTSSVLITPDDLNLNAGVEAIFFYLLKNYFVYSVRCVLRLCEKTNQIKVKLLYVPMTRNKDEKFEYEEGIWGNTLFDAAEYTEKHEELIYTYHNFQGIRAGDEFDYHSDWRWQERINFTTMVTRLLRGSQFSKLYKHNQLDRIKGRSLLKNNIYSKKHSLFYKKAVDQLKKYNLKSLQNISRILKNKLKVLKNKQRLLKTTNLKLLTSRKSRCIKSLNYARELLSETIKRLEFLGLTTVTAEEAIKSFKKNKPKYALFLKYFYLRKLVIYLKRRFVLLCIQKKNYKNMRVSFRRLKRTLKYQKIISHTNDILLEKWLKKNKKKYTKKLRLRKKLNKKYFYNKILVSKPVMNATTDTVNKYFLNRHTLGKEISILLHKNIQLKLKNVFIYCFQKKKVKLANWHSYFWKWAYRKKRFIYSGYYDILNSFFIICLIHFAENYLFQVLLNPFGFALKFNKYLYFIASIIKNYWRVRKKYNVIKITITGKLTGGTKRTKLKTFGYGRFSKNTIGRQIIHHFAQFSHVYGEFGIKLGMSIKQGKSVVRKRVRKKRFKQSRPLWIKRKERRLLKKSRRRIYGTIIYKEQSWAGHWLKSKKVNKIAFFGFYNDSKLKKLKYIKTKIKQQNQRKSYKFFKTNMARITKQYPKKPYSFVLKKYQEQVRASKTARYMRRGEALKYKEAQRWKLINRVRRLKEQEKLQVKRLKRLKVERLKRQERLKVKRLKRQERLKSERLKIKKQDLFNKIKEYQEQTMKQSEKKKQALINKIKEYQEQTIKQNSKKKQALTKTPKIKEYKEPVIMKQILKKNKKRVVIKNKY